MDNAGYHGYVGTNPRMNAAFIAAGPGIKKGAKIGLINNVDVAPTIARIFGLEMEGVAGKPLAELFE